MKVARVRLHQLSVPMSRPIKMAGEVVTHAHTLLVAIEDRDGRTGWGEASAAPLMTGETLGSLAASTAYLAQKLVGQDVAAPGEIASWFDTVLHGNASARACLETALMDLLAQRAGLPLHRLLRGSDAPADARLELLHMLASGNLEGELEEAATLRPQGWRHWKIKVGAGDVQSDLQRVAALSRALAGDVVSADANQMLSHEAARAIAITGRDNGMAFLEQPFAAGDAAGMAALHQATGINLCADESIHDTADIARHADARAAQGASLKLIKLGGTQALLEAGRLCLGRGLRVNLACKVAETTVSAAATAHAGFALGEVTWGFSMSNRYLADDVCAEPLAPRGGHVAIDQLARPGLGFAPEAQRLQAFANPEFPPREWSAP